MAMIAPRLSSLAELLPEHLLDPDGDVLGSPGLRGHLAGILGADREFAVAPELLDLGAANTRLIERRANLADVGRLSELELHQRAAGELDAVVRCLDGKRGKAEKNEGDRDRGHHLPPADEVVVGIVKNSKH